MEYLVGWGIAVGIIGSAAALRRALPELLRALAHRVAGRDTPAGPEVAELHQALAAMQTRLGDPRSAWSSRAAYWRSSATASACPARHAAAGTRDSGGRGFGSRIRAAHPPPVPSGLRSASATFLQRTPYPGDSPMRAVAISAGLLVVLLPVLQAQAAPSTTAQALTWGPAPAVFPPGAKMAVVNGDPSKRAPFTVQLSLPAGYKVPPHFHPTAELIEVKQGTLLAGMGDVLDLSKAQAMVVGAKALVPAKLHHFASAKGATVISVTALGPFAMTYVNAADDPQAAGKH
jgi:hypothetical protein